MSIKIVVAGPVGGGKTAVAARLIELLRKEGFVTELKGDVDEPVPDNHEMNLRLNQLVNRRTKVTVETAIVAAPRDSIRTC